MESIFKKYHLPEHFEVLCMLVFGILLQMLDGSPFTIKQKWEIVWNTELPVEHFSQFVQKCIKTVLSAIVVVRSVTTYAYVVSAMLVIFCISKNSSPKLMLLWLLVSGVKSISMTFLEALTGVYVCSAFGKIRKACLEFFVSKALEIIFAAYLWGSVLNIYQDMERKAETNKKTPLWEQLFLQKMNFRRHRARSLLDESTMYRTACLNYFEFKDVPKIIMQMLRREDEMSQDSLLSSGMMLASVSNLGSFDNLKTSQSLGELGFIDLKSAQVVGLEEDNLSPPDKALKFLKLTWSDVRRARKNKNDAVSDVYQVEDDTWNRVMAEDANVVKPRKERAKVFIGELSPVEPEERNEFSWKKLRKRSLDLKFSLSFFKFFQDKNLREVDQDEEERSTLEDKIELDDEEEANNGEESTSLFMSNIKEEAAVNRIRLDFMSKYLKGNAYAKLYKQEFMSVIGPELFDRAPKFPKVTLIHNAGVLMSPSFPAFSEESTTVRKTINLDDEALDKEEQTSGSDSSISYSEEGEDSKRNTFSFRKEETSETNEATLGDAEFPSGQKEQNRTGGGEEQSAPLKTRSNNASSDTQLENNAENQNTSSELLIYCGDQEENKKSQKILKSIHCYRKRRIVIRRIGRRDRQTTQMSTTSCSSENSQDLVDDREQLNMIDAPPESYKEEVQSEVRSVKSTSQDSNGEDQQVYYLKELFEKPFVDVLITYHTLKEKERMRRRANRLSPSQTTKLGKWMVRNRSYERFLDNVESGREKKRKVWKSKALEMAARYQNYESNESVTEIDVKELLRRRYYYLLTKKPQVGEVDVLNTSSFVADIITGESATIVNTLSNRNFSTAVRYDKSTCDSEIEQVNSEEEIKRDLPSFELPDKSDNVDNRNEKSTGSEALNIETTKPEKSDPEISGTGPEDPPYGQESEESFSLYYSKAADLASPLLDMKRFIYPDHIHYSYKHVKKRGFDVDITGDLPLLIRESLTMNTSLDMKKVENEANPDSRITKRPMDLSFAITNNFNEWQNDINLSETKPEGRYKKDKLSNSVKETKVKKKRSRKHSSHRGNPSVTETKPKQINFNDIKHLYSKKDYFLIQKLLQIKLGQNREYSKLEKEETPVHISSTQLHSNKGRINSMYNPAVFLQENKTRKEKRKTESQEERTKDMFARLEREVLLQRKNVNKRVGSIRRK